MRYDHIRDHEHHVSMKRRHMMITNRAAQFSSFKALSGFEEEIEETARLVDERITLTEDELAELDRAMQLLGESFYEQPQISVVYFVPDPKKNGGSYVSVSGAFRFIDMEERRMKFTDGITVPIDDIISIRFIEYRTA